MKKAYDSDHAARLVPLLEVITREMTERLQEVHALERRLTLAEAREDGSPESLELKAHLARHRRELHRCRAELDHLGCVVDEARPWRVRIPGTDGDLERGFQWELNHPLDPIADEPSAA